MREKFGTGVKLVLGAILLFYVIRSGMIDFSAVRTTLLTPTCIALAFLCLSITTLCVSFRWYVLAKVQGLSLNLKSILELTMIGGFFNTFMPGSVGGDLVKAYYVAGRAPEQKTRAVFSVLADRIIGLAVFFLAAGTTLLFHLNWLSARRELGALAIAVWVASGLLVVASLFFFSGLPEKIPFLRPVLNTLRRQPTLARLIEAAMLYRKHLPTILISGLISFISIFALIVFFRVLGGFLDINLSFSEYFFVVPIALIVSAVPVLPGGLGVGQVAFFTLFQWIGFPSPELGSTLCTVYQVYSLLFNCLGAIFYVRFKREPKFRTSSGDVFMAKRQPSR